MIAAKLFSRPAVDPANARHRAGGSTGPPPFLIIPHAKFSCNLLAVIPYESTAPDRYWRLVVSLPDLEVKVIIGCASDQSKKMLWLWIAVSVIFASTIIAGALQLSMKSKSTMLVSEHKEKSAVW